MGTSLLAAAVVSFSGLGPMPAVADLNKFEADIRGEFGIGSAAQYGSADLKSVCHQLPVLSHARMQSPESDDLLCLVSGRRSMSTRTSGYLFIFAPFKPLRASNNVDLQLSN